MAAKKASKKKEDLEVLLQEATSLLEEKIKTAKEEERREWFRILQGLHNRFQGIQVRVSASWKEKHKYWGK